MANGTKVVKEILSRMPKGASVDDIQYQIYVHQKAEDGMKAYREGRVMSQAEAEKRVKRWLGK